MADTGTIDLLEKSIVENHINYCEYSYFKNFRRIGENVIRANWKNTFVVLKPLDNQKLLNLKEEINLQRNVDFHENVLRFYGITKENNQVKKYSLVLEYADNGTLQTYLSEHFKELDWKNKCRLAFQLASAVKCVHEYGIIHRNLNPNNIFIHQKNIKLAGFGLTKKTAESSSNASEAFYVIPYTDPRSFDTNESYLLNEKSDIYSLGIIMWEISSGKQPFFGVKYDMELALEIQGGIREETVGGTPIEYSDLYKKCWNYEQKKRPNIQDVVSTLKSIISCDKENETYSENHEINFKETISLNNENIEFGSPNSQNINSVQSSKKEYDSVELIYNNIYCNDINYMIINKLIKYIVEKGMSFDQIRQLINRSILQLKQPVKDLIDWLTKNQQTTQYVWFLGLLYYHNISVIDDNNVKVFGLFSKAAKKDYSVAQVYLAKCYNDGYGTEQNKNLAFDWYRKAAKSGSIIGQFYLGYCYNHGIGTKRDEKESILWYEKASNNGNAIAKLYLANRYRLGKGVKKNENKAFQYYKMLAMKEKISDAQYQLGNCFYNGIGTKVDKEKALGWYKKATENGNILAKNILKKHKIKVRTNKTKEIKLLLISFGLNYVGIKLIKTNKVFNCFQKAAENGDKAAQYNLGNSYRKGEGIKKDERKALILYEKSAEQGHIDAIFQLGYCYDEGIGTDINKEKAFELYRMAAEKGNIDAQYSLSLLYELGEGTSNSKDEEKAFELIKKLAKQGNLNARYKLAYYYDRGIGTEINKPKAFKLYKNTALKGNFYAQNSLGILYESGQGIEKSLRKAIYWYSKAAENGYDVAQYNLGRFYQFGIGIEKDELKALKLYKSAAEKGNLGGQFQLGYCYFNGIGIEADKEKAFKLYKVAAEEGHNLAQSNLALLYEKGEGTEKDLETAIYWYDKAAENGDKTAQYNLESAKQRHEKINKSRITNIKRFNNNISFAKMDKKDIAIKELQIDKSHLSSIQQEINDIGNNSNIVEILDIRIKDNDNLLLIMPFANDGNLRNYIKSKLNLRQKIKIAINITDGIKFLHDNKVVHENLNPENILIFDGIAKISNLPLLYDNNKDFYFDEDLFNNIGYIDPNSFLDENSEKNESIDIYSLGVILWEIMSEKIPYSEDQDKDILQLIEEIRVGYRGEKEEDVTGVPVDYVELYRKCWSKNSLDRPSINCICEQLEEIIQKID